MSRFIEFHAEDGSTMNVAHKAARGTVKSWLDDPTYNVVTFEINKEQAIDIILLLEAAFL